MQEQEQNGKGKTELVYHSCKFCGLSGFCLNEWLFTQSSFGKVTIQIDRVVMLGAVAGEYSLLPESKSGPRNLEIEFQWSN